jgi:hypothetical protein
LMSIYQGFIDVLPGVIGAIIVLLIGYIIAGLISTIVDKVLHKIKFDKWVIEKTHIKRVAGEFKLTKFIAVVIKWYVFILFLPPAAGLVKLDMLASLLNTIALWVPQIILAIIVALIGFLVAEYVGQMIIETKTRGARFIADIAKFVILVIFALVVLEQIGIKIALVQNAVLVVLAGVVLAFALGFGLAFGLGGRDEASVMIGELKKKM